MSREPLWKLVWRLQDEATAIIEGRASFERDVLGRKSDKPLPTMEVDPNDMLRVLAAIEGDTDD